jgi:Omp85 superfamily domain/Calcineurin-like phosphoesterase
MLRYLTLYLTFLTVSTVNAQSDAGIQRIFLIGDAGELKNGKHPVIDELIKTADWNDEHNTVIYLGDNIYPQGLPQSGDKNFSIKQKIIDYQLSVVKDKKAKAFFVPGNHDWKDGKPGGWEQVKNLQQYIAGLQMANVKVYPENGCPGPIEVMLNDKVVMVFMDSQWWLEQNEKPGLESDCDCKTEEDILTNLKEIIAENTDKLLLVVMHHPFYTHGKHGGYFTLKQHIFPLTEANSGLYVPLPVLGSLYPITRGVFGNIQDTRHPQYKNMIKRIEEVLKNHPNVIHVAGHEHSLQLLKHDSITYIVSGAGSKSEQVKKGKNTVFAKQSIGYAVLEITASGKVAVKFYEAAATGLEEPIYTTSLKTIMPTTATIQNNAIPDFPDSMTIAGSKKFTAGGLKKLLLGGNYRKEWMEPIRVPVFNMEKELGGLTPLRRGGGHQSKSLRLKDADGKQYVLRSVEKFVTDAALPPDLRGTVAKDLVSDGVSASYPYAALSVPVLAAATGVPHAEPKLVYVPDDPRLGKYKIDFANTLCLFEVRDPGGAKKTYSTDDMAAKLADDNDNKIDQPQVLNARVLDMFMMDFDRHEDQWRWAAVDTGKGKTFFVIPRDRDQPFFISRGVLPYFASRPWIAPQVQGFRAKAKNINTYNFNAKNFDRAFLNELSAEDWKRIVDDFLSKLTDEIIEQALIRQPKEIQKYSSQKIIAALKERRKYFESEMMSYYNFLSKIVNITGSDKKELFDVNRKADGSVLVTVYKINKESESSKKMYERQFDPAVTKEIRLYGLSGDDKFLFHGEGHKIKISVIGGNGNDVFENNASGKTVVYDWLNEQNSFAGNGRIVKKLSNDAAVNKYERLYYKYNQWIPAVSVNFNPDDGVYLGASIKHIAHGFRKTPYSMMYQLTVNHSLSTKAYNIRYNADFIKAIGNADLLIRSDIKAPDNVTNFFSYGNESIFDKTQSGKIRYYRARFQLGDIALLLRKNIGSSVSLSAGPAFQFYGFDPGDNAGRYVLQTGTNGLNAATLFKNKSYLGGQLSLGIDTRNNKALPSRGINWQTNFKILSGLNNASNQLTQLNSDLSLFTSFSTPANVVIATRFGGGINFNKDFEFFQAQYLGGTDNLRGFRKYRFAGKSMLFNNTELRIKLADFRTYLLPGSIGLLFFNDIGRVWIENDNSSKWHNGFGGGLWIAPLKRLAITASITKSDEETLPLITFGWQF